MDLTSTLADGHRLLGYLVLAGLVGSTGLALTRDRAGAAYEDGLPKLVGLLLAIQVLFGLMLYGAGGYWDVGAGVAYAHPVLMIGAVGLAGAATARARRAAEDAEVDGGGWGEIARLHGIATLVVVGGILTAMSG